MFAEVAPWVRDGLIYMAFFSAAAAIIGGVIGFTSRFFVKPMLQQTIDDAFAKKAEEQTKYEDKVDKKFDDFEAKIDKRFDEFHESLSQLHKDQQATSAEVARIAARDAASRTRHNDLEVNP